MIYVLLGLLVVAAGLYAWYRSRKKAKEDAPLPPTYAQLMAEHVPYYNSLPDDKKPLFEEQVRYFLTHVNIEGVDTEVDDVDRILVASSAVIPIFAFDNWHYPNLTTVLLYPATFNQESFATDGADRNTLGMVGEGSGLQSTMVLSKPALRAGFANTTSKENTAIHEFVHLLDKTDGAIDGTPDFMLSKEHIKPWVRLIHQNMQAIKGHHSDINPYGITNEAEFFAVVSEYFFKRPDLLQSKHPDLFASLEEIFRQNPLTSEKVIEPESGTDNASEAENLKTER